MSLQIETLFLNLLTKFQSYDKILNAYYYKNTSFLKETTVKYLFHLAISKWFIVWQLLAAFLDLFLVAEIFWYVLCPQIFLEHFLRFSNVPFHFKIECYQRKLMRSVKPKHVVSFHRDSLGDLIWNGSIFSILLISISSFLFPLWFFFFFFFW